MKIITTFNQQNTKFVGLTAALTYIEPSTLVWLPTQKPAFDMFDEMNPDLLFCSSEDFSSDLIMALKEYKTPVVVLGLNFPSNIQPKLVCVNDLPQQILDNISVPYYKLLPAANSAQFNSHFLDPVIDEKYQSDVFYLSTTSPQQNPEILKILEQVCMQTDLKIKFAGPQHLPFAQYVGQASIKHLVSFIKSAKITIDCTHNHWLDIAYNKSFCLSSVPLEYYPSFNSYKELFEQMTHFLDDEQHRSHYIKKAYNYAKHNTYFHRLGDIFKLLDMSELSEKSFNKAEQI